MGISMQSFQSRSCSHEPSPIYARIGEVIREQVERVGQ